jgi:S-layer homology domain
MTDHTTPRRRVRTALALVAAGLVGGVGATAANAALFPDVPTEGRYGEHVANLQEAGIATGYADGSFRPADDINRRQMAAWIDRSTSRVGSDLYGGDEDGMVLDSADPTVTLAEIEMSSLAAPSGEGWVTLHGAVGATILEGEENCPCLVWITVFDQDDNEVAATVVTLLPNGSGTAMNVTPLFGLTPLPGSESNTYRVVATLDDTSITALVGSSFTALYTPMSGGGVQSATAPSPTTDPVESIVPALP